MKEAKEEYIASKAEIQEIPQSEITITDEDMVPLEILNEMLRRRSERKHEDPEFLRNYLRKV